MKTERVRRTTAIATATALCVAALSFAPTAAWADESDVVDETTVAEALAGVGGSLVATAASGVGEIALDGGTVEVPDNLTDGVTFTAPDGSELAITLPGAEAAGDASVLADGTVTYPAEDFSNAIVVSDIGVQMLTTIADSSAPTTFEYEVALEPGQVLQIVDGGAAVVNADGTVAVSVADAWAVDANGAAVPTTYEVEGSTLVQHVDHTSDFVAYPVVADPFFLAPWVVRCLIGIGLNGPQISRIASAGSPGAILAAFGFGALRCVLGR